MLFISIVFSLCFYLAGSSAFAVDFAPGALDIPTGVRLLIFSPHPDDETLAAGGLIQRVRANGGKVRVVFITNGDGFLEGVRKKHSDGMISAEDFIKYGITRQEEALKAISHLGLKQKNAIFLGFPDQGIDQLWQYWSRFRPYTSPYTRFNHCGYRSSYKKLKYNGCDLQVELDRIMQEFKPDWLIIPDPRDFHPDHAATGLFVLDTLKDFQGQGRIPISKLQVFSYLVHYRDYPCSPEWRKRIETTGVGSSNIAAKELSGSMWFDFMLSPEELLQKEIALNCYPSQLEVIGGLMRQFDRPFETFSRMTSEQVLAVSSEYEKHSPQPRTILGNRKKSTRRDNDSPIMDLGCGW